MKLNVLLHEVSATKTFRSNSIGRALGFLELLFSILVALKCPGALLHCGKL